MRVRNQVTGQSSVPTAATYATDGSVFVPAYQAPMVICGPGLPEKAHQPNEFIRRDAFERGTAIILKVVEKMCC